MTKPAKLKDAQIQAWLDYLDDALTAQSIRIAALETVQPTLIPDYSTELTRIASRLAALEAYRPPDTAAGVVAQVQMNTQALIQARADLDKFLKDADSSIQLISLLDKTLSFVLQGDRTSAVEEVRKWRPR